MIHDDRQEIVKLVEPDISEKQVVGFNTGLRPYREKGIRIEVEKIGTKSVLHNYGHGGGGVSLFFGSCKQAMEKFDEYCLKTKSSPKSVTVIGSG